MSLYSNSSNKLPSSTSGFTLLELIIVALIIGILSAIATPAWIGFTERQRLSVAQSQVYRVMKQAQSNAKRDKITWQASFREQDNIVQWAIHPASINSNNANWQNLESGIRIDQETTLVKTDNVRRLRYNYQGCPVYQLDDQCTQTTIRTKGRITLSSTNSGKTKRCVIVSTLLGVLRTSQEQTKADRKGRYCY